MKAHILILWSSFAAGGAALAAAELFAHRLPLSAFILGLLTTSFVAAIMGVIVAVLTLPLIVRRRGEGKPVHWRTVRFLSLLVVDGGWGRRPVLLATGMSVLALVTWLTALNIIPQVETNFERLMPLYAVVTTCSALLPVILVRGLTWRSHRWAPNAMIVWLLLCSAAYHVVREAWVGVSPYTVWGALPVLVVLAAAAVFVVGQRWAKLRLATYILSGTVTVIGLGLVIFYPGRSAAHAAVQTGPIVASGSWQLLAMVLDHDGDEMTSLGGIDCAGFDYERRVAAMEIVGDGVDNNCMGGDLQAYEPAPSPKGRASWRGSMRPNVIVVTVDALRADAIGRVVKGKAVTPAIDKLMEGTVTFENAYSVAAATDESVPAMWTGMYPADWHQHNLYFGVEPTVADVLGASGYETIAVIVHPWLPQSIYRGFDLVDNSQADVFRENSRTRTGPTTTNLAIEHVDGRDTTKPLLLWVHYFDTHLPRYAHADLAPWLGSDSYLHATYLVDREIGRLFAGLDQRGLVDGSVIVFASDHGEGLGDHNVETHAWALWESLIRVPFAMRLPGLPAGQVKQRVSTISMLPTLFDALGIEDVVQRDAASLVPLITDPNASAPPLFLENPIVTTPTHFAVIDGDMKYWVDYTRAAFRLFDLAADPEELDNLIDARPDEAARLSKLLGEWRDRTYNDLRLRRKRDLWERHAGWEPERFIGSKESVSTDEMPDQ